MLTTLLLLMVAACAASAEDQRRPHNYMLSDDFIEEINREATTWRAGRNFHPLTSANYIKVRVHNLVVTGTQFKVTQKHAYCLFVTLL